MEPYGYMTTDESGNKEYATEDEVVELMQTFNSRHNHCSEEEDRASLRGRWSKMRIGSNEDHYWIERLKEPKFYSEDLCGYFTDAELAEEYRGCCENTAESNGVVAGVDFPGTL